MYYQVVDDMAGTVLAGVCGTSKAIADNDKEQFAESRAVGEEIARLATEKGVTSIVFDRGGCKYHGRVKALADAVRKSGLEF
jgi:large subunit ribosomal protein L18